MTRVIAAIKTLIVGEEKNRLVSVGILSKECSTAAKTINLTELGKTLTVQTATTVKQIQIVKVGRNLASAVTAITVCCIAVKILNSFNELFMQVI